MTCYVIYARFDSKHACKTSSFIHLLTRVTKPKWKPLLLSSQTKSQNPHQIHTSMIHLIWRWRDARTAWNQYKTTLILYIHVLGPSYSFGFILQIIHISYNCILHARHLQVLRLDLGNIKVDTQVGKRTQPDHTSWDDTGRYTLVLIHFMWLHFMILCGFQIVISCLYIKVDLFKSSGDMNRYVTSIKLRKNQGTTCRVPRVIDQEVNE